MARIHRMETAINEDRLTQSTALQAIPDEAVIEQLEDLYQMIRESLVMTMTSVGMHDLKLEANLCSSKIDAISDLANAKIPDLESAAAFVQTIKEEDMEEKSVGKLYLLMWSDIKIKLWKWIHWKKYLQMTDRSQNYRNAFHEHRMTFLRTLLLMANVRRRQAKQAMTDPE